MDSVATLDSSFHLDHCQFCVILKQCPMWMSSEASICPLINCSNQRCSLVMHECKLDDHLAICPLSVVPCVNFIYGCDVLLPNAKRAAHLEKCEASVVVCCESHGREQSRSLNKFRQVFDKYVENISTLDVDDECGSFGLESYSKFYNDLYNYHISIVGKIEENRSPTDESRQVWSIARESDADLSNSKRILAPKKCITCAKLGNICMYDQEIINKKPFWVEARTHFTQEQQQPRGTGRDVEYGAIMSPYLSKCSQVNKLSTRKLLDVPVSLFACNKIMRRDEFASHWLLHHNLLYELQPVKCPQWSIGCPYSTSIVDENGTFKLCFNKTSNTVTIRDNQKLALLDTIKMDEVTCSILDLPFDVLLYLLKYLDSFSLKSLSQTSSHLRWVVSEYNIIYKRGMIVSRWEKETNFTTAATADQSSLPFFDRRVRWVLSSLHELQPRSHDDDTTANEQLVSADCFNYSNECFLPTDNIAKHHYDGGTGAPAAVCSDDDHRTIPFSSVAATSSEIFRLCGQRTMPGPKLAAHLDQCGFVDKCTYSEYLNSELNSDKSRTVIPLPGLINSQQA